MSNTYNGVVAACWTLRPLLAQSGVNGRRHQPPLLGAKRASTLHNNRWTRGGCRRKAKMSALRKVGMSVFSLLVVRFGRPESRPEDAVRYRLWRPRWTHCRTSPHRYRLKLSVVPAAPVVPPRPAAIAARKKPSAAKPEGRISVGGAPLPAAAPGDQIAAIR
jgi:hypothetical protein